LDTCFGLSQFHGHDGSWLVWEVALSVSDTTTRFTTSIEQDKVEYLTLNIMFSVPCSLHGSFGYDFFYNHEVMEKIINGKLT
jgi:hypothetical protein